MSGHSATICQYRSHGICELLTRNEQLGGLGHILLTVLEQETAGESAQYPG
jgi:hypothetical protein